MVQSFYQLCLGIGTTFSLASMKPRREPFLKGVLLVPLGVFICGMLSAMTIFIYLSHFCGEIGIDINDPALNISGPELVFNVFPKALASLPFPNLFIFVFFATMVLLGIDSEFGLMEGLYCYLNNEYHHGPVVLFGRRLSLAQMQYILVLILLIPSPTLTSQAGIYFL